MYGFLISKRFLGQELNWGPPGPFRSMARYVLRYLAQSNKVAVVDE
jgi:hypothetical protein